jgi:cobalt-zinc-cadmium efflux system protein
MLSEVAHMLTDAGALAISLVVIRLVARPAAGNLTFGLKRTEVLSAQGRRFRRPRARVQLRPAQA